ncbi:hypothetical protein HK103_001854 [Boothiomyces macroporosus]|uniref:Uncharacterized protein n=1 Tax=Boothiomyces macroporosus TaxID=261099 RepID=A0AAD5UAT8_9FUNG|nr:hypothetical protein HK103_001854 [Boothiomyces macroporosus]
MKFLLASLMSSAAAYITGAVMFYEQDCPAGGQLPPIFNIKPDSKITPKNVESIKSLQWAYPSTSFQLLFYLNDAATDPYAVITGPPNPSYSGNLCGFQNPKGLQVLSLNDAVIGNSDRLFINDDSYCKFILV